MSHVVIKTFNTITRRFGVGASVSESDDLAPHSIESLKTGGFITEESPTQSSASWPTSSAADSQTA